MNEPLDEEMRARIPAGERVVWAGRPDPRRWLLAPVNLALVPLSVMFAGFALFWEFSVLSFDAPWFFKLWGLPFVAMGLYLLIGRWWVAAREARATRYLITDRRIVIRGGAFRPHFTEIELRSIPALQLNAGRDGFGTITFGVPAFTDMAATAAAAMPWAGVSYTPAFRAIPDVATVYRTLQQARDAR